MAFSCHFPACPCRARTSPTPAVLKVEADCSSVFLDGTETMGSAAGVTISVSSPSSPEVLQVVRIVVLYPTIPITIKISRNPLSLVKDVMNTACVQQFQSAAVLASAVFSTGGSAGASPSLSLDVTNLVAHKLTSSAPNIVGIEIARDNSGNVVEARAVGKAQGQSFLTVKRGTRTLGLVLAFPTSRHVTVSSLGMLPITNMALSWDSTSVSSVGPASVVPGFKAVARMDRTLVQDGEEAPLVASVAFSDRSQDNVAASELHGLELLSLNTSVVEVSALGDGVVAKGSGKGSLVAATLTGQMCHNRTVVSCTVPVQVAIPVPVSVELSLSASSITIGGSGQIAGNLFRADSTTGQMVGLSCYG